MTDISNTTETSHANPEAPRYRSLSGVPSAILFVATLIAIALAANQLLGINSRLGFVYVDSVYLYWLTAVTVSLVFLVVPASARARRDRVPLYDYGLFFITVGIFAYFGVKGESIIIRGWEYNAPDHAQYLALVAWAVILEAARRTGGTAVFIVALTISLYPLFADKPPAAFSGISMDLLPTAMFHVFSSESLMGIPFQAFGLIVFGFLIFGVALLHTGGGKFFIDLGFGLLGSVRGGPAKVAVVSSALFGSISGGTVSNVLTTGTMTIPAMQRIGFSAKQAAGIEACASTGGVLMPPVMGATAFVMASFLGMSYADIAIAAIIPSLLFYISLFITVDASSAYRGSTGLPREELPALRKVMKEGWYYIVSFALLVWMLLALRREVVAPFYATIALLLVNQVFYRNRLGWRELVALVKGVGLLLAELGAVLSAVGLIVGALTVTGVVGSITNDLVNLAGGHVILLLIMGAVAAFVLGLGMTSTAAYVVLAVVLAPALVETGVEPLAIHLFLLYWGMISFITPPVALSAFAAASVAGTKPMETAWSAMTTGVVIYFIPFWFVLNPALIGMGSAWEIALGGLAALFGVFLVASATQNYLLGYGRIGSGSTGLVARALVFIAGIVLATPGSKFVPWTDIETVIIAIICFCGAAALSLGGGRYMKRKIA